jgi:ribosomal protein L30E
MSTNLPMTGDIKDQDLTQILIQLQEQKATGSLILQNNEAVKSIHLKEGNIVYASSNLPGDRLGEILFRLGKITPEQFKRSVELLKETGKQQGAILVEEGYITAKELFEGLKHQVKEIIYSLFLWEEGQYQFIEEDLPKHAISLQLDMVDLISEVIDRIQSSAG